MSEKKTLLELAKNYADFMERLVDGAETDEELDKLIAEFDESAKEPFEAKCDAYARIDKMLAADLAALYALIEPLSKRGASIERSRKGLRRRLLLAFDVLGLQKVKTLVATLYTMRTESVMVDDERRIPELYWRVTREPAKSEIWKAIKEGGTVPGAHIEESKALVIR